MSKGELNTSRWLEAHCDRSANLTTLPNNLAFANVSDGDYRLVLTDIKTDDFTARLKVFNGTMLCSDQLLPDTPSGVIRFCSDSNESNLQAVGVACGSDLFIYKNNKPFYKFSVPTQPITALEQDVWQKLSHDPESSYGAEIARLQSVPYTSLSARSQSLIGLSQTDAKDYITTFSTIEPVRSSPITCLTTLNRTSEDRRAVSCPVLATESGQIFILDSKSFTPIYEARVSNVKAVPSVIRASGTFDVGYRIVVACREQYVTLLRRGWLEGKHILQTAAPIIDMVLIPGDGFICLATSDRMLNCYTKKGNRLWSIKMAYTITCLCLVQLYHLSTSLVAVGLQNGTIQLYLGREPVDYIIAPDAPSAITFGQLGQEEHVMVIITSSGTMNLKILKRTANFDLSQDSGISPTTHTKPLPLPKRSKLFLEQAIRERQHAIDIHRTFQQDLLKLRLEAARATFKLSSDQFKTDNERENLKLAAQVLGLGPTFTLILTLDNLNSGEALVGFSAVFQCDPSICAISPILLQIPLVPPGSSFKLETKVIERLNAEKLNQDDYGVVSSTIIRVFIVKTGHIQPVLSAIINMPPTDPLAYTI